MDNLLEFMKIVALLCISVLSIYLIVALVRLQKIFANIQRDISEVTSKAIPVFTNLDAITTKVRTIAEGMKDEFDSVRYSLQSLRDMVDSIVDFEQRIQGKIEEPIMDSVSSFSGLVKGVKTFFQFLRI